MAVLQPSSEYSDLRWEYDTPKKDCLLAIFFIPPYYPGLRHSSPSYIHNNNSSIPLVWVVMSLPRKDEPELVYFELYITTHGLLHESFGYTKHNEENKKSFTYYCSDFSWWR